MLNHKLPPVLLVVTLVVRGGILLELTETEESLAPRVQGVLLMRGV